MESSESTAPNLRNLENPTTMRLTDHTLNPILSPVLAWFGGGGSKGPSSSEKAAAAAQTAAAEKRAEEQAAMMKEQMRVQAEQAEEQKRQQELTMAKMEANKAAPGARVDQNAPDDQLPAAQRRKGMRRSILAGESNQMGYDSSKQSTLG
jgi:ribosomal protein S11